MRGSRGGKLALCAWALRTELMLPLPLALPLLLCSSERRWDRAAICRVRGLVATRYIYYAPKPQTITKKKAYAQHT